MPTPRQRLFALISVGGGGGGARNQYAPATGWADYKANVKPWADGVLLRAVRGSAKGYSGSGVGLDYLGKPIVAEVDGKYPPELAWLETGFTAAWKPWIAANPGKTVIAHDTSVRDEDAGLSAPQLFVKYMKPFTDSGAMYCADCASALRRDQPTWDTINYAYTYKQKRTWVESSEVWEPQRWILERPGVAGVVADFDRWQLCVKEPVGWWTPVDLARRGLEGVCSIGVDDHAERIRLALWAVDNGLSPAPMAWDLTDAEAATIKARIAARGAI